MDQFDEEFLNVISSMCSPDEGDSGLPIISGGIEECSLPHAGAAEAEAPRDEVGRARGLPFQELLGKTTSSNIDATDFAVACAFDKDDSIFFESFDNSDFLSLPSKPSIESAFLMTTRKKRSRTEDDEADASRISIETALHLKKLNIDPESKEGKVEKRKIQNRMSAQMHRERKRLYIETLELQLQEREKLIHELMVYTKYLMATLDGLGCSYEKRNLLDSSKSRVLSSASSAGGTSSESDSDESSQHSTKSSLASQKSLSAGLTLFSFLFFVYMAFVPSPRNLFEAPSSRESLVPVPTGRVISDRSLSFTEGAYHDHVGNDYRATFPATSAPPAPALSAVGSEARLPPPEHTTILGSVPPSFHRVPSNSAKSNRSLWTSEEHVAQLYPYTVDTTVHPAPRKPVRVPPTSTQSGSLRGSIPQHKESVVYDRALSIKTPAAYARPYSPHSDLSPDPNNNIPIASIDWSLASQALMLDGRALLDPILLSSNWDIHSYAPSKAVILNTGSGAQSHKAAVMGLLPASASASSAGSDNSGGGGLGPDRVYSGLFEDGNRDPNLDQGASRPHDGDAKSVAPFSGPLLTMLLPASSVRWTSVWAADASPEDYDLLRSVLGARYRDELSHTANSSDYWIEIGCSIVKARIVKNITHI
jgi:hypothetical protein